MKSLGGNSNDNRRLVEDPEVKKTIKFDELSIEHASVEMVGGYAAEQSHLAGAVYPIIRINDMDFSKNTIAYRKLSTAKMVMATAAKLKWFYMVFNFLKKTMINRLLTYPVDKRHASRLQNYF